ncbi:daptide-type RiPP biosynthesis dehydogenase [Streptomyces sioyaensis]|uniref:daptide-type RiPP biosynthesis dehydogenase n=1 Tax=Streptomyces sioyaensis TaxID=67364 RepID=UPI0033EF78F9
MSPPPTSVTYGAGTARTVGREITLGPVALLVDPSVADTPFVEQIRNDVTEFTEDLIERVIDHQQDGWAVIEDLSYHLTSCATLVAIGGGTVLDQAKLAAATAASDYSANRLRKRNRSGLVLLPELADAPQLHRIYIPTTVGTGAEVSTVACLTEDNSKQLVMSPGLRPDLAILDPGATATLPHFLMTEGLFEALHRVLAPFIGDKPGRHRGDEEALRLAEMIIEAGEALTDHNRVSAEVPEDLRLRVAMLSAKTHMGGANAGRDPFAAKGWFLANELSCTLHIRKTTALAAVTPVIWARIDAGDTRLGNSHRMHWIWSHLRRIAKTPLPEQPAPGLSVLMDSWSIERTLEGANQKVNEATIRSIRAWGNGLPMMGGLRAEEIHSLFSDALTGNLDGYSC